MALSPRSGAGLLLLVGCASVAVGPPPSLTAGDAPTRWLSGGAYDGPSALWKGLAAWEALDDREAAELWVGLAVSNEPSAPRAARLLSAQATLSDELRGILARASLRPEVRAPLSWAGHIEPRYWANEAELEAGGRRWRVARSGDATLDIGGGRGRGTATLRTCFGLETSYAGLVIVWTNARGRLRVGDKSFMLEEGQKTLRVEAQPGPHALEAELSFDDPEPRFGVFWPAAGQWTSCADDRVGAKWAQVDAPPAPSTWSQRYLLARETEAGFGANARLRELALGWVRRGAPGSPPLVSAWARWANDEGAEGEAISVTAEGASPRGRLLWASASFPTAPEPAEAALRELMSRGAPATEALLSALLLSGRSDEAAALMVGRAPGQLSWPMRRAAAEALMAGGQAAEAARFLSDPPSRLERARVIALGSATEAIAALGSAEDWSQSEALAGAGWAFALGRYSKALAYAQRALRARPFSIPALRLAVEAGNAVGARDEVDAYMARLRAEGEVRIDMELAFGGLRRRLLPLGVDAMELYRGELLRGTRSGQDGVVLFDARDETLLPGGGMLSRLSIVEHVLTRSGVEHVGQVTPPPESVILEIATLEPDGARHAARGHLGTPDLSLVKLDRGDAVVVDWLTAEPNFAGPATAFSFRGEAPTRLARLRLHAPAGARVRHLELNGLGPPRRLADGSLEWKMEDVPAWVPEPNGPDPREVLPLVVAWIEGAREEAKEVNRAKLQQREHPWLESLGAATMDEGGVEALMVLARRIRPGAEQDPLRTLLSEEGDRARLLAALTRARGGELVMGRPGSAPRWPARIPDPNRHSEPLVKLVRNGGITWMGCDAAACWSGRLPPAFRGGTYLTADGDVRPFSAADIGVEHLRTEVELELDGLDARGVVRIQPRGPWREDVLRRLKDTAGADLQQQLQLGLTELLGPLEVLGHRVEDDDLVAEVRLADWAQREGPRISVRAPSSVPPSALLFGHTAPKDLTNPAVRTTPLVLPERSELLSFVVRMKSVAPLDPPEPFLRTAPFGSFSRRFEWRSDGFALERSWSWSGLRVQPEDMPIFTNVVHRSRTALVSRLVFVAEFMP